MIDFWTIAAALLLGILGFVLLVYLLCWALPHIMPVIKELCDGDFYQWLDRNFMGISLLFYYSMFSLFMWAVYVGIIRL